jgi:hypothetical protein
LACAFIHLALVVEIRGDSLVEVLSLVRRIFLSRSGFYTRAGTQMTILVACDLPQPSWRVSGFSPIAVQRLPDEWHAD